MSLFARYSDAPSSLVQRAGFAFGYSTLLHTQARTQTITVGGNETITSHTINEFRFNYSRSRANSFLTLDDFGGAVPPSSSVLLPTAHSLSTSSFTLPRDTNPVS